jgi:hypothetical protein
MSIMQKCLPNDFDIAVRGDALPYMVTARYQQQSAGASLHTNIDQEPWTNFLPALADTIRLPDVDLLAEVGSLLFRSLFQGDVRDLWIAARRDLELDASHSIRIRLALQPPAVAALPWETLFDPDRSWIFGASSRTPLVRYEDQFRFVTPPRPLLAQLPLKVLVVAPTDSTRQINADAEIAGIQRMLHTLGSDKIQVELLPGEVTLQDLRRKARALQPDALHFISHGATDGIYLWQRRKPTLIPSRSLATVLDDAPSLKLIFLNSCLAGSESGPRRFLSPGAHLLQRGAPAVIAMQFQILDSIAIDFAHALYEELLSGACPGAIDLAVSSARSTLYALAPGDVSFANPILWLNAKDGLIFQPLPDGSTKKSQARKQKKSPAGDPLPHDSVNIAEEERWLKRTEAALDLSKLPSQLQFAADELYTAIKTLHTQLKRLRNLERRGASVPYLHTVAQYRRDKAQVLRLRRKLEEAIDNYSN